MKPALFYAMYAFPRFTRAGAKNPLGELQAQFAMLWLQSSLGISFISCFFQQQFADTNPYVAGIVVFASLYLPDRPLFALDTAEWRTYSARFAALSRSKRTFADVSVGVLFLVSVIATPVRVKWLRTGSI